jgi:uncharacterized protein
MRVAWLLLLIAMHVWAQEDPGKDSTLYQTLLPQAEAGDVGAQVALAYLYSQGRGVALDHTVAAQWYQRAAEAGFADAQFFLGNCYLEGRGVAKDVNKAREWYEKAAAQNNQEALFNLGNFWIFGLGERRDASLGLGYWQKAAALGHDKSILNLAVYHFQADAHHAADPAEALRWIELGKTKRLPMAWFMSGLAAWQGLGTEKDWVAAQLALQQARQLGHPLAAARLQNLQQEIQRARVTVQKTGALFRAPGQADVVRRVRKGQQVVVLQQQQDWVLVHDQWPDSAKGWIPARLLSKK